MKIVHSVTAENVDRLKATFAVLTQMPNGTLEWIPPAWTVLLEREGPPPPDNDMALIIAYEAPQDDTQCPWCGTTGPDFDESPRPSAYCYHDVDRSPETTLDERALEERRNVHGY